MIRFACQAILFDLDGVLVDSTPCVTRVWSAWAQEHGLDAEYVVHVAHGRPTIATVREVAPHLDAQSETDRIEQREINDTDGLRVLPGAKELLAKLPVNRYTIVTSGTRQLATRRLQVAGLPVPSDMITADDITNGKPDPEPYLAGARVLGYAPDRCLVFEDAPSGIRAAKAARHGCHRCSNNLQAGGTGGGRHGHSFPAGRSRHDRTRRTESLRRARVNTASSHLP